jgi:hypothetical protein
MDDAARARADERQRTWTSRLARSKEEAQSFEDASDDGLTSEQRLLMVWDITRKMAAIGSVDASELRLDRSITRIERRRC